MWPSARPRRRRAPPRPPPPPLWGGGGPPAPPRRPPTVAPVTKTAATASSAASIVGEVDAACRAARTPHRGPTFVDIPLDAFGPGTVELPAGDLAVASAPEPETVSQVAKLVGDAARPV